MKTRKPRLKQLTKPVFKKSKKRVDVFIKHCRMKRVNEKNRNDRLEILKTKYEQEIRTKERELQTLKAKLASLKVFAQESEKLANPKSEPDRYAKMGMTQAILGAVDCLKSVGVNGATQSQIRDFMIAHGFPLTEKPHNFSIAVSVTLRRLVEDGRVKKHFDEDGSFYKPATGMRMLQ